MKFRLKIMLCMIWLLSLAFGIGGSVMIWGSFSSALAQEKQTAEDSYRFLVRTIEMVNSINTLPNTSDIAGVLKQMDSMGITNFSAIRLLSGGVTEYTSGNTELSSDYTESGIVIETARTEHIIISSAALSAPRPTRSRSSPFTTFHRFSRCATGSLKRMLSCLRRPLPCAPCCRISSRCG